MAQASVAIRYEQSSSTDAHGVEAWIGEFVAAAASSGCVASEIEPPSPGGRAQWLVTLDFDSPGGLAEWFASPEHHRQVEDSRALFDGPASYYVRSGPSMLPSPTALMNLAVAPDAAVRFMHWQLDILAEMFGRPGFSAAEVHPPATAKGSDDWTVIVRFDSEANLDAWLTSEERARFHRMIDSDLDQRDRRIGSSFAGWFDRPAPPEGGAIDPPPRWKQAMTVLVLLYPAVVLLSEFFTPWLEDELGFSWPEAVFAQLVAAVAFLTWVGTPLAQRVLNPWLHGAGDRSSRLRRLVPLAIMGLYIAMVALFTITL